jgi:hypothetical protein
MTTKRYLTHRITALLACSAVIFFAGCRQREKKQEDRIFLQAVAVQTPYGWGYNILAGDKIYIHQDYIPVIPGKQGFKSAADALRAGKRVVDKISSNQPPALTWEDMREMGFLEK